MSQTNTLPSVSIHDTTPEDRWRTVIPYPSVWIGGREYLYVDSGGPGHSTIELVEVATQEKLEVEQQFAERTRTLKDDLDAQVRQLTGPLDNLIHQQIVERQSAATRQLLAEKSAALPAQQQTALKFFGQSPLDKTINDFLREVLRRPGDDNHQNWLTSYKAAHEAKLLTSSVDYLTSKAKGLEVAKRTAAHELKRVARLEKKIRDVDVLLANLDLARHEHQVNSRQLQDGLDTFARHDFETLAEEQAPLHGKMLETELAELLQAVSAHNASLSETVKYAIRLKVNEEVLKSSLQFAPPRNTLPATLATANDLLQKSAQALAEHEPQREKNLRLASEFSKRINAAMNSANNELARIAALGGSEIPQRPYTYRLPADSTTRVQVITPSTASMSAFAVAGTALGTALQAARPFLVGPPRLALEVASLLLFSFRLDHGDRYGVSSPLQELLPGFDPQELIDSIGKHLDVPIRLISGMLGENSHIQAVGTNAEDVAAGVPVRQATWDATQGAYSFVTDGPGPITVLWTPQGQPVDSSTTLPSEDPPQRLYPGIISVPSIPKLLTFPSTSDLHFDDYIVTFPADSGIEPVYIMFKNPRDYAGAGVGNGRDISGWEEAVYSASGAPLPTRIADQLRGRIFSRWGKMREAIWKAVAADSQLSKNFTELNVSKMRRGGSPYTDIGQLGSNQVLELHHIHPIAEGGAVYDIDNLLIMTPRAHADAHKTRDQ